MNNNCDLYHAIKKNDIPLLETLIGLSKYNNEIKTTYQSNCLDLLEGKTKRFFFKLYILNNGKWEFFDYGWLDRKGHFYANKTKVLIFNIPNIYFYTTRHPLSENNIIIVYDNVSYMLFNKYPEVVDILFKN